jgi:Tol biopolymer transport system component
MRDTKEMLQHARERFAPPGDVMESLRRRRERRERNRRLSAGALAVILALVTFVVLARALGSSVRPANKPPPRPPGIFSEVGGWIAYGNADGIWAVDASHPSDRESRVRLSSSNGGTPLAWSNDGSELLIARQGSAASGLFVLHADGTETRLVPALVRGASFSPDGTTVVFATIHSAALDPGIYVIDADGGVPRLLLEAEPRYFPDEDRSLLTDLSLPTFSPDGTQIAYIDGLGDWGNSLRVMNVDGSNAHVLDGSDPHLLEASEASSVGSLGMHPNGLSWSPDGTRLAVGLLNPGICVVDADGAGLTLTIPDGANPYWSPDGTRISYQLGHFSQNRYWPISPLMIAAADGTEILEFGYAESGPWNPIVPEPAD